MLYWDLKHEATAECFKPDKTQAASFLNVLWNSPLNTLIHDESLEIYRSINFFFKYKDTYIFITYIDPTRLWFSFVFSS